MSSDLSEIIDTVDNNMCIWDPCPQCLAYPTPLAACRKEASDRANPMGENKYFVESKQCGDWREYKTHPSIPGSNITRADALRYMPRYRNSDSHFRFAIILAGPPGSGKSALKTAIKGDLSNRINNRVNNLPYVNLEIDDIVKNDPSFNIPYQTIEHPSLDEPIDISSPSWSSYINETNELYNQFRMGNNGMNKAEMMQFALDNSLPILENLNQTYSDDQIRSLIISKNYYELKSIINNVNNYGIQIPNYLLLCLISCFSIKLGLNITYETTFKTTESVEFLFKAAQQLTNDCENYNYIFILGLPIVKYSELKSRILSRFVKNLENNIPDIGLPDFNNCKFEQALQKAYLNIASLVDNCTGPNKGACYDIGIDYLVIYDNSENEEKVAKFFDAVPITTRSYILASKNKGKQATELQIKSRRAFISLLMNNLNCLESESQCLELSESSICSEQKCDSSEGCSSCDKTCKTIISPENFSLPDPNITPGLRSFSLEDHSKQDDVYTDREELIKNKQKLLKTLYNRHMGRGGRKTRKIRR